MKRQPVVLIPACNRVLDRYPFHVVNKKYIDAVRLARCMPLVVPFVQLDEIDDLLDRADGVFLTGSPSNVHPSHFGESVLDEALPLDPERDGWTLPMIPRVLERGLPLFAICRGFQEANVALGGSLHQAVHAVPGQRDHRSPLEAPPEVTYAIAHPVEVTPGGLLADIARARTIEVNSVHGQGVNRLAPGLFIEARAPDGLVEAFSKPDAAGFNLCVQWHPEWQATKNPVSMGMLTAFGDACRDYLQRRDEPAPDR
jgi:putative glutamine amidotransferase